MFDSGRDERQPSVAEVYTEEQIESVLGAFGIEVVQETENDFLCFCPFHGNVHTPSFSVSREHGKYICFNHACNEQGSLRELVEEVANVDPFKAARLIAKHRNGASIDWEAVAKKRQERKDNSKFPTFGQDKIDEMHAALWDSKGHEYMVGRGYDDKTLAEFQVGYSAKRDMITVPMHDVKGNPVGVIGRGVGSKIFKNSKRLPSSRTLFNLHRAKMDAEVIICEASFDAMRIHQAGFPNVVSTLMGHFSTTHLELIEKYFTNIVIFTDNDDKQFYDNCRKCGRKGHNLCLGHNPGRELGYTIADRLPMKRLSWARFDEQTLYPRNVKDPGDMTVDEVKQCLQNRVSNFIYQQWV